MNEKHTTFDIKMADLVVKHHLLEHSNDKTTKNQQENGISTMKSGAKLQVNIV